ncbi:MAG TPA: trehalose-phosphatase [Sunxiuqinia sp.]|nr:trehalose-phosphatase [Sunxiuqinia sp.]
MKIELKGIRAAIFDMDGVITQTARVHEKSWKKLFDGYLKSKDEKADPFRHQDYLAFVDGKPRYKGVQSFLESRNIELDYGNPEDSPDQETICGLGNQKNTYFKKILEEEGVELYDDTVQRIKQWRKEGLKIAVVSSSKNCKPVLEKAGVLDLFDVRVDGVVAADMELKGKPDPDIFLEAARQLEVPVGRAIVFEDAESGVKAGKAGQFAFVIGVNRADANQALLESGADWVVHELLELAIQKGNSEAPEFQQQFPSALDNIDAIRKKMNQYKAAFFFDYDGTLSPIVSQPEDAIMDAEMRHTIKQFAQQYPLAIVSGRDMHDVKKLVNLNELIYAGSHGFHIEGPDNLKMEHDDAQSILSLLDELETKMQIEMKTQIDGVRIDRKKYAIAVHYRNVADSKVAAVQKYVKDLTDKYDELKLGTGKRILEMKPAIDWDKGKAVYWLLEQLNLKEEETLPIYIGDDVTDEDAFRAVAGRGIGILVGEHDEPSAADYSLKSVDEVKLFLDRLLEC